MSRERFCSFPIHMSKKTWRVKIGTEKKPPRAGGGGRGSEPERVFSFPPFFLEEFILKKKKKKSSCDDSILKCPAKTLSVILNFSLWRLER